MVNEANVATLHVAPLSLALPLSCEDGTGNERRLARSDVVLVCRPLVVARSFSWSILQCLAQRL